MSDRGTWTRHDDGSSSGGHPAPGARRPGRLVAMPGRPRPMGYRWPVPRRGATAVRLLASALMVIGVVLASLPAPTAGAVALGGAAAPQPFGHPCTLEPYGVRFCPTASLAERVPSFDGAPLDVDVTLPATGSGPWPTIVMIPPSDESKTVYESTEASGDTSFGDDYSNVWYAEHGYAVVTYDLRGTYDSCGTLQSRIGTPACDGVEFELADQRYDARDVQWLLGLLVDEGIAEPDALGVTGDSLGSIVALELALLYDRVRLPDGAFAPWRSPDGVPLHIAAAYTNASIADVVAAVAPNGRFVSSDPTTAATDHSPIGVAKLSFPLAAVAGYSPASDYWNVPPSPGAFDLPADVALLETAEPGNPALAAAVAQLAEYHQAIGIPIGTATAPILMEDGWDDVVANGASQALRLAEYVRAADPNATIDLQLMDFGHPLSGNSGAQFEASAAQGTAFFDHYLRGRPGGPAPGSVMATTSPCPAGATPAGPFVAPSMQALDPGVVRFSSMAPQTVVSGGDPVIGVDLDWLVAGEGLSGGACQPFPAEDWPGTAVYTQRVEQTFTMLGLPTMTLHVDTLGADGQLDARLWDVAPDGRETFVARGTYALTDDQQGTITWQMWGGGHTFEKGDTIRVELLAADVPTQRPSPIPFVVRVSDFSIALPSQQPANGGQITPP
jgi:hypothetical protein